MPITATAGVALAPAVQVRALDAQGSPATSFTGSVHIALATNPGGATLSGSTTLNAVAGVASFTDLSLDRSGAGYTLSATATGLTGVTSGALTVSPAAASQLVFTTQPATVSAGNTIAPAVVVAARDAFGNLATGFAGSVTVAIATNPGPGTLSGTTTRAVAAGMATFGDLSVDKVGAGYTFQATAVPSVTPATSTSFDVSTGTAAKLAFLVQPSSATGGATITPTVQVEVQDAGGNRVTTATNSVTLAIGANPNNGSLGGTKTVAAAAGVATFSSLTIDSAGAGYTLSASATGVAGGATSTAFAITVGPAATLGFRVQPTSTTGGATIAPTVQVEIRDAGGNRVTGATNIVAVALGTNPTGGALGGTKSVAAVGGVASFSTLTVDSAGTGYTLTATAASLTAATSVAFNVSVGPATQLAFRVQPSGAASGATISPAVQVEVRDAGGNRVTTASHTITLAFQNNPGGGTLSGLTSLGATNGLATFSALSVDKAGVGYTLQAAASPALTPATSAPFTIGSGAADHLSFFVQPADGAAGATITPAIQVEVQDAAGNRVTTDTRSITVAIQDNPSGGALSGTATVSALSGVATFASLSINKAGTGYSLLATAVPALPSVTSVDFNIAPGAASRVSFFVEPSVTTAGAVIAPAMQVEILDAFSNRVGTATTTITVALAANPGGGTLSGTKNRAAVAGVATFTGLSINKTGVGYTIRASASGLTPDTSVVFDITPGAAAQLFFTVQPANTAAAAPIAPALAVTARDAQGNTATGFSGDVTLAIGTNAGPGTLTGVKTVAAVSGIATFSSLSIDKIGTGYTLAASATGVAGGVSNTFNITLGAAASLAFVISPSSTTGGATIAPAIQVEIRDAGNNRVTTSSQTVALAIGTNPNAGALNGTASVAASSGLATFSTLSIDSAGAGYDLVASASGLANATSSAFDISVGPAAQLGFLVEPSNTGAGSPIAPAVQVEVRDLGGNRVTAGSKSVSLAIDNNPGGGTLAGTTPVSSSAGIATFSDLAINNPGVGYTLIASATGVTSPTSSAFDISIGGAAKLAFVVQPSSTTGGATISPAVEVQVQDAGGNLVAGATNSVTVGIATNPNGGALSGTKTVGAQAGVATFSTLTIDSAGAGYTLSATASGLIGATSGAFTVAVGPAAKVGFLVQPSNTAGGATITPSAKVEIRDAGGNRVAGATNSVTVAISTNPTGGSLSGTKTIPAAAGVATFSTLSIDSAGTGYRLSASAAGLTDGTSNPFNITVGPAAKLGFLVPPSDATAGASIAPAVKVEIQDAGGNRVTGASNSVTVALAANPGGGTLSGTTPVSAASGVATFSNLSINKRATGYTLQATSGALGAVTSPPFDVAADGVDALQSSLIAATDTIGQCAFSCAPGIQSSTVTVTVKDQFGNLVNGAPVVLSASGSGNGFSPSAAGTTDASGVFTAAFNSSLAEAKTISATAGGVGISQTGTAAVMPVLVGAGDIADCFSIRDDATANQLDSIPGVVFAAGDNAYANGTAANFASCYDPTWGRHKARTKPVVGNHEYDSSGTAAAYFNYFTPAVADPLSNGFGYYSFDLGTWHVVVLNSDSGVTNPTSGPAQLAWLQTDLVGRASQCVLAIWHRPLFTSGSSNGGSTRIRRLWQALENAGAEIVINGHDHLYERFAPQDSLGTANPAGIREFIVGTGGGETHANYVNSPPNVEASDAGMFSRGVVRLTLYDRSYRWEFLPAQGQGTFTDSGTASCH